MNPPEVEAVANPQAGDPTAGVTQAATPPATPPTQQAEPGAQSQLSNEELQKVLADVRKEAAATRVELKKFKDKEQALTDAQLSEVERLKKQLADQTSAAEQATNSVKQLRIEQQIERAAGKLKFNDPADVLPLIQSKIEYNEVGEPTNVEKLLDALAKAKPYLTSVVTNPSLATSPANPPRQGGEPLTREKLRTMSAADIVRLQGTPEFLALTAKK